MIYLKGTHMAGLVLGGWPSKIGHWGPRHIYAQVHNIHRCSWIDWQAIAFLSKKCNSMHEEASVQEWDSGSPGTPTVNRRHSFSHLVPHHTPKQPKRLIDDSGQEFLCRMAIEHRQSTQKRERWLKKKGPWLIIVDASMQNTSWSKAARKSPNLLHSLCPMIAVQFFKNNDPSMWFATKRFHHPNHSFLILISSFQLLIFCRPRCF